MDKRKAYDMLVDANDRQRNLLDICRNLMIQQLWTLSPLEHGKEVSPDNLVILLSRTKRILEKVEIYLDPTLLTGKDLTPNGNVIPLVPIGPGAPRVQPESESGEDVSGC
jgi:hypothetical protein